MINRKQFIAQSTLAATGLLFESYAQPLKFPSVRDGFQLKILATDWGFPGTLDEYGAKVKAAGYDGIEIWWSLDPSRQDAVFSMLKKYGLEVGFLCAGSESDAATHFEHFEKMVEGAVRNTRQRPLYINCHSGHDFFSYEENTKFIDLTTALSRETGIHILHETHRSRMLFAAPVARRFLEAHPDLRITFDVSHWCNVSESLLADQPQTMALALERTDHIHARIGHPEGPQVSDPRAPEWQPAAQAHFAWWDAILRRKKQKGEVMTILTEFGPPDYMPTMPYTHKPLTDQWAINEYMLQTLRKRYA
ncbi:MAG TPA: TIM barrel protein [Puia sp.]|nr:TIM barrel protein [Puia sp.]